MSLVNRQVRAPIPQQLANAATAEAIRYASTPQFWNDFSTRYGEAVNYWFPANWSNAKQPYNYRKHVKNSTMYNTTNTTSGYVKRPRKTKKYSRKTKMSSRLSQIGFDHGESVCRRHAYNQTTFAAVTRQLYQDSLINIPKRTSTFDLNTRSRDVVDLRGIQLSYCLSHYSGSVPMMVNICIVGLKDNTAGVVSQTDMFRGDGTGDRGIDFSTTLDSNRLCNLPLNSDNLIVLYRKQIQLSGTTSDNDHANVKNHYIKIDRQMRYDASNDPHQDIRLVWWVDSMRAIATSASIPNAAYIGIRATTLFRDID